MDLVVEELRTSFPAMGTTVEVVVVDGDDADLHWAHEQVRAAEQRWSRFLPTSEVRAVTAGAGTWVPVSVDTFRLLEAAAAAATVTGGAFDPLLASALEALGYVHGLPTAPVPARSPELGSDSEAGALELDQRRGLARVPAGRALDLGGIAKGWLADRLVAGCIVRGAAGACANVGGDLAVAGESPDGAGWLLAVDHGPAAGVRLGGVRLRRGGLATSTTRRRRWVDDDGRTLHHLLDPATGRPVDDDGARPVDVTVVAPRAATAEVLAKVAFVAPAALPGLLADAGAGALVTHADGATSAVGRLPEVVPC